MTKAVNYGTVTKEVIKNYNEWIKHSMLTKDKLLSYRKFKDIEIDVVKKENKTYAIQLIVNHSNKIIKIGEPLLPYDVKLNEQFIIDASFMLLYIAQRLDDENKRDLPIGFTDNDKEYFYRKFRNQINEKLLV